MKFPRYKSLTLLLLPPIITTIHLVTCPVVLGDVLLNDLDVDGEAPDQVVGVDWVANLN